MLGYPLEMFQVGVPILFALLPAHASHGPVAEDYVGVWETDLGRLELDVYGDGVMGRCSGPYYLDPLDDSRMWGKVVDGELRLEYVAPEGTGNAKLRLSDNGGLVGSWAADEPSEEGGEWTGVPVPDAGPSSPFAGLWETNYGRLRLAGPAHQLVGAYESRVSTQLTGSVRDGILHYTYSEGETKGSGQFRLAKDGSRIRGTWTADGDIGKSQWFGRRVVSDPEAVWLVVLEAPWEESLREPEYAFGDMLRGFFRMSSGRHVKVRQRSFHDLQDFERFASEVNFLAEPTVLLIASHGMPSGIAVNESLIGPESVAKTLQAAEHVRLLHLSGCSLMHGDFSAKLHDALPPQTRLPISGYSTEVDWDTSAIADFVFLSLVLLRGLSPLDALVESHQAAPFTGKSTAEGAEFMALGLEVRMPGVPVPKQLPR